MRLQIVKDQADENTLQDWREERLTLHNLRQQNPANLQTERQRVEVHVAELGQATANHVNNLEQRLKDKAVAYVAHET